MSYVVIDHHHDAEQGVYKLQVGVAVYDERLVLDEKGLPVMDDVDGSEDGAVARTEQVLVGYEDVHDYVFAADDERWFMDGEKKTHRLGREQIAETQRAIVVKALEQRAAAAQEPEPATAVSPMPGVGEAL